MAGALTVSSITGLALSYFCMEGVVRSFIDFANDERTIERLTPLGDAGGWFSLCLFTTLAVKSIFDRIIAEGEYIRLEEICHDWYYNNQNANPNTLYLKLNALYSAFQARCLFSKSLLSRRLTLLNILQAAPKTELLNLDSKLQDTFLSINMQIKKKTEIKQCCRRLMLGHKQLRKKGCLIATSATIFGIAFPIHLVVNVCLSLIGEVGLGKELFHDREDVTRTGHFGEWLINAIEAFAGAYLLLLWYQINQADLKINRRVYKSHIESLKDHEDKSLRNRLCEIANEELAQISTTCDNMNLPEDYEFEKL
jgi:hypothetical protein